MVAQGLVHFSRSAGAAVAPVDGEPDWAARYWAVKLDRAAPGIPSLLIDVQQTIENLRSGPGVSGVLDRQSSPDAVAGRSPNRESLANGQHGNQLADVVCLKLAGEEIAVWVNERRIPGTRFSWGPEGGGALVFAAEHGGLVFLYGARRRQSVPKIKYASLPAWSQDGGRVAFIQPAGRKKLSISWLAVSR